MTGGPTPKVGDTVWYWDPDVLGPTRPAVAFVQSVYPGAAADLFVLLPVNNLLKRPTTRVERVPFAYDPGGCCWTWPC